MNDDLKKEETKVKINHIYNEDCLKTMKRMPDNYIDLVVTSPPYDNLRTYKDDVDKTWNESVWKAILKELSRVIKVGGVVVWIVNDATIKGSETGTSFKQALYAIECGLKLYDTMIWGKQGYIPTQSRYYNSFEYMFVFSKGKPKSLNFICDRKNKTAGVKFRSERKVGFTKKGEKLDKHNNEKFTPEFSRRTNYWYVPVGPNKTKHPAIFPEKLAHDHIISWSNENDLVYDPFMGSGTTAKVAKELNRNFIGSELSKEYCGIAEARVKNVQGQFNWSINK